MSYFKLTPNGLSNPVKEWGTLGNLRRIMARNDDTFDKYVRTNPRTLPNQNPLVQFLLLFSVNVEWTPDYLINVIDLHLNQYASTLDMTSLYKRGNDHIGALYPETNHHTLLVVPFDKPSRQQIDGYFTKEINELVPLYPIYTTDYKQRWDIMELIDTKEYKSDKDLYTIVQVDPYALIIGFYRWLKRGVDIGNSPHGYLAAFPLMNLYLYHNELVNFNYLNSNEEKINVVKGQFNLEPYFIQLKDYTDWKNRYLMSQPMKSFTNFMGVNEVVNIAVDVDKMVYPSAGKSLFFVQMSWVWSIASLGMVKHYLEYNNLLGTVDGKMKADLKLYFQYSVSTQENQIKSLPWRQHFSMLHEQVSRLS
ncbi:hypothetical protein D5W64_13260 [Salmonella enterica subsp. enterica serovar Saintpaul]|nr:hypothetical protein [Salmonella enterica subsp. enterica serovar Saintpaul]